MKSRAGPLLLALVLTGVTPLLAQSAPARQPTSQPQPPPAAQSSQPAKPADNSTGELPVNLDRIKRELDRAPAIRLSDNQLRFYLTIYGKQGPRFEDIVGNFDLKNGPVPRAGMTHKDFLDMVTPKELYSTGGGITPLEVLQFSITNWAAQALIKKGLQQIREAKNEREIQAIRERIDRELAALLGKQ